MRKRLLLAVVATGLMFTAMTLAMTMAVTPVDAQSELEQARVDVAEATDRLEQYLADLEATQRRGDALAATFWQVQSGFERLDLDIAASQQIADELAAQRAGLQAEVRVIAVDQYVSGTEEAGLGDHASEADKAAAETLARLVVGEDNDALGQLAVLDAEQTVRNDLLVEQREQQVLALDEVTTTQASLVQELDQLTRLRVSLDDELTALEAALDQLEAAEAERQAAAAERARIEEDRRRAEAAAAAAAELARQVPTPAPTAVPPPTAVPTAVPTATAVPNPQLPDPTATAVPNPQPGEPFPTATAVPNPQLPDPTATPVPNPQPSTPPSGGGIVCPLAGPFTHTDDFNSPRAVGGVHRANDLISAQGTPVLAAAAGTVEHRDSRVGGLSAHLKGDNGDYYFYTHLSGYESVGAGHVAAGTVIGYVGMTGNAPIPHLHFEIHRGGYGNYTNPYGPVRQACF